MELRSGAMSGREPTVSEAAPEPPPTSVSWRVARPLTVFKAIGVVVFIGAALLFVADTGRLVLAGLAAVLLAVYALRDVLAPVRLAADTEGVTVVTGYANHRQIPWSDVERVRVDTRRRLGTRSELLEVDTGETLHLFSAQELGAPISDVVAELRRLRSAAG